MVAMELFERLRRYPLTGDDDWMIHWPSQEPKLEVPIKTYKAYVSEYPQQNIASYGTVPPF